MKTTHTIRPRCAGITLAELLVGLAILAILAAAAAPSLQRLIARQMVVQTADVLAGALALARSAAMARREEVLVEPLGGADSFSGGWQVRPASANQPIAAGRLADTCLQVTLRQTEQGGHALRFTAVGYSRSESGGFQAATIAVSCRDVQRQVRLGAQGRIRLCTPGRDSACDSVDVAEPS